MLIAVLSGLILSIALLLTRLSKSWHSLLLALYPASLFVYFGSFLSGITKGEQFSFNYQWVPSLDINMNFRLDGLALLFCFLITGIGTLIFLYASVYLKNHPYLNRFFCYLSAFMAAMLGLVLSDNLLMLFLFWELTSITSFFLIGFNNDAPASRKSALMALAITGGGGFLLLAGFILIGTAAHSYSIQELLASKALLQGHSAYIAMLVLIFAGAFTKSAQFPFHFWLPGAMKAPTPVSAYLHSATMVKAGIYLLARLTPVLGDHIYWNTTLLVVGGFTMAYAALHATFRTDLKGILAYSTISALGLMVFLLGIGTEAAIMAVSLFILVHALYKATLFLTTGVIDHEAHTRDVTQLSGLKKVMLPLAIAGILAALSSSGIPLTYGFIGKDLIYEATTHTAKFAIGITALAVITNILLAYSGYVAGIKPFLGKLPEKFAGIHLPSPLLWGPPLLLSLIGMVLGIMPGLSEGLLFKVSKSIGVNSAIPELQIWHGFNIVLILSVLTIVLGILLYLIRKPAHEKLKMISRFDAISPQHLILASARGFAMLSSKYTKTLQNGYLRIYVIIIVSFLMALLAYRLTEVNFHINLNALTPISIYEVVVFVLMIVAVAIIIFTSSRLTSIIAMSVVGYSMCLYFVFYGAPDLAMTQFTIDTLTVVLFMLVLLKLPPFLNLSNKGVKVRDGLISIGFGVIISLITVMVLQEPTHKEISRFYAENAYTLAHGKNIVNVILVDFRGSDTLIEIMVLTIAAIGVYSMLKLRINDSEKE